MPFLSFICSGADEGFSLVTSNENREGEESGKTIDRLGFSQDKTYLVYKRSRFLTLITIPKSGFLAKSCFQSLLLRYISKL